MQLFESLQLKFSEPNWAKNPEFGLLDTILESHPELIQMLAIDISGGVNQSNFGRKDIPSVEQIVRAAIYKEMKQLNYRELEYHQDDSRICEQFVKIDPLRPYSFQMFQKYISRIQSENLQRLLVELNKIAIQLGLEDLQKLRQDSTVVESNIHYPTNNSLVWDCIKESDRLLKQLQEEVWGLPYRNYIKGAKRTYFKINNTRSGDKRADLFKKQLNLFTKSINQVSNAVKKKFNSSSIAAMALDQQLQDLLPTMYQVFDMTYKREILGLIVPNDQKIFSIYERHTDIIVKGGRNVQFGHKINLSTGKSNLILSCEILRGNPADSNLFRSTLNQVLDNYNKPIRDIATDGGYASAQNLDYAQEKGISNIVFNKVVGSLKSKTSSLNMTTRLKRWRSGIEANISNLKRGFGLFRCNWKGWNNFQSKIMWSVIAYNIRVMTAAVMTQIKPLLSQPLKI